MADDETLNKVLHNHGSLIESDGDNPDTPTTSEQIAKCALTSGLVSMDMTAAVEKSLKRPIANRIENYESRELGWTATCENIVYAGFGRTYRVEFDEHEKGGE